MSPVRIKFYCIIFILLIGVLVQGAPCGLKTTSEIKHLIKVYEKMNADPNMQNSTIRKDRVVVPKELIHKLKRKG